ncbi:MAG: FHA domain-containing protein [Spirochaetes bacterium]|nr:FHA domain-containing protein [Spirochaetota bacterium]
MEPIDLPFPPDVFLEVLDGAREGLLFPITDKTVTIGREPGCDLVLQDPYVSRKHCQIVFRRDHFTVLDLGSLNKTKVKNNPYIQRNLKHDYILSLGKTRLRFVWEKANEWVREQEQAGLMNRGAESDDTIHPEA